jgi:hypothetical protein
MGVEHLRQTCGSAAVFSDDEHLRALCGRKESTKSQVHLKRGTHVSHSAGGLNGAIFYVTVRAPVKDAGAVLQRSSQHRGSDEKCKSAQERRS